MHEPLRILTEPYDRICTNMGCDHRAGMTLYQKVRAAALTYARIGFLMCCCGVIGGSISLRVHAQGIPSIQERAAKLEVSGALMETRQAILEMRQDHADSAIATMQGVGIGLGSALGFLQVLQIILGRSK